MTTIDLDLCTIAAHDGTLLQYEVLGRGEPIVFVHGGFTNRASWKRQREPLAPHFRLILRDLRGHDGAPSVEPPGYRFDTTEADDMLAVLDAEGVDRVDLVGHSTGGAIAFLFALRHPERVRRMLLIEPTLPSLLTPELVETHCGFIDRALENVERDGPLAYLYAMIAPLLGQDWDTRMPPKFVAQVRAQAAIAVAHGRAFHAMAVGDEELRALAVPTLLLYGDHSLEIEPLIRERIVAVRPDLDCRTISGASHSVHSDQPDAVNAAIVEFFAEDCRPVARAGCS